MANLFWQESLWVVTLHKDALKLLFFSSQEKPVRALGQLWPVGQRSLPSPSAHSAGHSQQRCPEEDGVSWAGRFDRG